MSKLGNFQALRVMYKYKLSSRKKVRVMLGIFFCRRFYFFNDFWEISHPSWLFPFYDTIYVIEYPLVSILCNRFHQTHSSTSIY